jgi:hypothetical protein
MQAETMRGVNVELVVKHGEHEVTHSGGLAVSERGYYLRALFTGSGRSGDYLTPRA